MPLFRFFMSFRHSPRSQNIAALCLISLLLLLAAPHAARAQTGYVVRNVTNSAQGIGALYDNGTSVGIGTTGPIAALEIDASATPAVHVKDSGGFFIDLQPATTSLYAGKSGNYFTTLNLINAGMNLVDTGNTGHTLIRVADGVINTNAIMSGNVSGTTYSPLTITGTQFAVSATAPAINFQTFLSNGSAYQSNLEIFGGNYGMILEPNGGNVGIGTTSPNATLDVNSNSIIIEQSHTPADNAACTAGTIWWDASYIYVCTASGTVKRAALSAF